MHYTYLLRCSDNTYYTGCTSNLEDRLDRHSKGLVHSTKNKLPVILLSLINTKPMNFERYLKSGSGIAFRNKRLI